MNKMRFVLVFACVVAGLLGIASETDAAQCCYDKIICAESWAECWTWALPSCAGCTYYCHVWCDQYGYAWYDWYIYCPPPSQCGGG